MRQTPDALRLVIFDVDGTLVDSQNLIVAAQQEAFATVGLPPPTRAESLSIVGLSLHEAFSTLVGPTGPIAALAEAYKEAFGALRADPNLVEPFFPGAVETVAAFTGRNDILLGIATGKSRRGVAHILERSGWSGLFATVQTADDNPSKPSPAMIERALAETGVDAANAVMVGDTTFDMLMAMNAGVHALGVSWGYHPPDALLSAGAEGIAGTFDDVRRWLEAWPPARRTEREAAHG